MMAAKTSWILRGISWIAALAGLAYPFLIYSGWQRVNPRFFLGIALAVLILRLAIAAMVLKRSQWKEMLAPWLLPAAFLTIAFLLGRETLSLYWPAVVSAALLIAFGRTLAHPPTLVERFARLQKSSLTPEEILYCRHVTQLWCLFFIVNGLIASLLAWQGFLRAWTLYSGVISYILGGTLMGSEYLYRHWRFRPEGALVTTWMNRWC